jgi:polysaccharide export outer membrane protein
LRSGDIVRIAPMLPRFENTVTLRGNVAWPGRYPWHEGMRILDLIPTKEALLTRDFWRQQNPVYSATGEIRLGPNTRYSPRQENVSPGTNSNPAGTQRSQTDLRAATNAGPDDLVNWGDEENYQRTPNTSSGNTAENSARQATYAASTTSLGETTLRNDIKAAAPEINWDYAVVQRITDTDLSTTLIPFNLGKAVIDKDSSQNLPLYPGDVVTVFSQQDIKVPIEKQVKFVRLEGEFVASGVYRVEPGETLRHLVQRVGGLTPNAYLFGSEFTRESTRERQQQELNRIVGDLEVQVERNATTGASAAASPEAAALLGPSLEGQRRLVEKLRQLRPTGRIVLELPGPKAKIQDLPNIALEDGDRFVVPYRPASVEVLGSVYNANAFIWKSEKRMSDYLRDAGGPNRNADKKHIFVLRACPEELERLDADILAARPWSSINCCP